MEEVPLTSVSEHVALESSALESSPATPVPRDDACFETFSLVIRCVAVILVIVAASLLLVFLWDSHAVLRVQWDTPVLFRVARRGQLANGLTFRMLALPTVPSPLCAVNLLMRAGADDEEAGQTGQAHLLEHMLFDQAGNITGRNQIFLEFETLGIGYNAFTSFDVTVLQAWDVPQDSIVPVLNIFRMQVGSLNLTDANVAIELGAVLGEARRGNASSEVSRGMYDHHFALFGSALNWPIGNHDDLTDRANASSLARFWHRHYHSQNMELQLVCGGSSLPVINVTSIFGDLVARPHQNQTNFPVARPVSRILLVPPTFGVDEAEVVFMVSSGVDRPISDPPTPREIYQVQASSVFETMFSSLFAAAFPSAPHMASVSSRQKFSRRIVSTLELAAGTDGVEMVPHALVAAKSVLSQLSRVSESSSLLAAVFSAIELRQQISTSGVASDLAHGRLVSLPGERNTLVSPIAPLVRERAAELLLVVSSLLSDEKANCNCSLAIAVAPLARVESATLFQRLRDSVSVSSASRTEHDDVLKVVFSRSRRAPVPDKLPLKQVEIEHQLRIAIPADANATRLSINNNRTQLAALFVESMSSPLLRISAVNNFGPHLCQLVSFVALPLVFADHGKPYFAASSVRAVCEGRRMMLDFSGRLDYVLVAACLRPLVSRSVLRALRRAEADRELDRRTRGDWNEFVDQTNNATANTFVWDKGSFTSVWEMDAVSVQEQLWSTLSRPDVLYVGPASMLNVSLLSAALANVAVGPPLYSAASPSSWFRNFSVAAAPSPFLREQSTVCIRLSRRPGVHPQLLMRLLYLQLFVSLRGYYGYCYAVSLRLLELRPDSLDVSASWIAGSDFPRLAYNGSVATPSFRTSLDTFAVGFEPRIWKAVASGVAVRATRGVSAETALMQLQLLLWGENAVLVNPSAQLDVRAGHEKVFLFVADLSSKAVRASNAKLSVAFLAADLTQDGVVRLL